VVLSILARRTNVQLATAWWPSSDGRRNRIVLLNDNNFLAGEPTRLLLLALSPLITRPYAP
jgi:hypothetical protein